MAKEPFHGRRRRIYMNASVVLLEIMSSIVDWQKTLLRYLKTFQLSPLTRGQVLLLRVTRTMEPLHWGNIERDRRSVEELEIFQFILILTVSDDLGIEDAGSYQCRGPLHSGTT